MVCFVCGKRKGRRKGEEKLRSEMRMKWSQVISISFYVKLFNLKVYEKGLREMSLGWAGVHDVCSVYLGAYPIQVDLLPK